MHHRHRIVVHDSFVTITGLPLKSLLAQVLVAAAVLLLLIIIFSSICWGGGRNCTGGGD